MRVEYRDPDKNALLAAAIGGVVLVPLAAVVSHSDSAGVELVWSAPGLVVCGALMIARCLRRSVVVDDAGITRRSAWATWFVAWSAIRALTLTGENTCTIARFGGGGDPLTLEVAPGPGEPTLAEVCAGWRSAVPHPDRDPQRYPRAGRESLCFVMTVSVIALFVGLPVWIEALRDGDAYAARAARERQGVAVVSDVRVETTGDGDGGHNDTTLVTAWLRLDDARVYDLEIHRPGDVARRYAVEDQVPVVYDAAHPRDADFADRPIRRSDDSSVSLRKVTGPVLLFAGLIGVLVVGALMAHDWRRRFG
jgi:hypothetical protein